MALLETEQGVLWSLDFSSTRALNLALARSNAWFYLAEILREDARLLFAFNSLSEREVFTALIQVKDVGPKTAALLVAELGAEGILRLMQEGTWKGLKIAGVGPKTWDSICFGLNKKKKQILPILSTAQASAALPVDEGTKVQASTSPVKTSSSTWSRPQFVSEALVQTFEKLGLNAAQTQALFEQCHKESEEFEGMTDAQRIPFMLKLHGQHRGMGLNP